MTVAHRQCWKASTPCLILVAAVPLTIQPTCKLLPGVSSAVLNARVSTKVLRRFSIGFSTGSQQGFQHWFSAGFISTIVWCFLLLAGPGRRPWPFLCCKSSMLLAFLVPQGLITPATQVPGVCWFCCCNCYFHGVFSTTAGFKWVPLL